MNIFRRFKKIESPIEREARIRRYGEEQKRKEALKEAYKETRFKEQLHQEKARATRDVKQMYAPSPRGSGNIFSQRNPFLDSMIGTSKRVEQKLQQNKFTTKNVVVNGQTYSRRIEKKLKAKAPVSSSKKVLFDIKLPEYVMRL